MKQNRVDAVLKNLDAMGLSQVLITDPLSILYLTGRLIKPMERFYALYLNNKGGHKIFINQLETVPEDLGVEKVRFSDSDPYLDYVFSAIDHGEKLGVDKNLPARFLLPLMDRSAAAGYENASLAVDKARAVKDEQERELMRRSSKINEMAMAALKERIRPGVTELQLAGEMEELYASFGADGLSFPPLVAFGANAASGHHYPDATALKPGDCVMFDAGCTYGGYCSDMTRTYFYKSVTDRQAMVYNTVLEAMQAAIDLVRPGVELRDLDLAAREVITKAGFGPNFTHRLGHFIGLEDHDYGDVSVSATDLALPGNIFSIEPGIYLEGEMGVRIEDLILVTDEGYENLNSLSKELEVVQ
ncbi:MAG: aminopeptidase P family protein [Oscillospiraceae bacterium]|nr:aminopeptidase P family protein [Oscillospiraceae bacterium]